MTPTKALQILVLSFLLIGCFSKFHQARDGLARLFKRAASSSGSEKDLCQNPMDLLFILDSSESVGAANWEKVLNFTRKVAAKFDVQYTRFGAIQYHSVPEVPIVLSSFHDNITLDNAIGSIFYKPGSTRTDLAITKAAEVFNKAPLRKASRVAIFVIGGRSTDLFVSQGKSINATDLIKKPAADLQAANVAVYAASVSEGLPAKESMTFKGELNVLTSKPPLEHIFDSTTYDDLLSAKPAEVAKKTCVVNGGMSAWSAWSTCSVTCGTGTRVRMRTCNNPKPDNGGLSCSESTVETGECSVQPCKVHKPEVGSPWPQPPTSCKPNKPTVYGYPDLKTCGNGFELIKLAPHQLSASSTYSKDTGDKIIQYRHAPYNGLLNNTQNAGAWCAEHQFAVSQDANQYLSIDLGTPTLIGKVATQGMENWNNWVSIYSFKFSIDNINWQNYPRSLQGNCDRRTITENVLNPPVRARFIRVNPTAWYTAFDPTQHDICMRVGIYKCRDCKLVPVSRCNINVLGKTKQSDTSQVKQAEFSTKQ